MLSLPTTHGLWQWRWPATAAVVAVVLLRLARRRRGSSPPTLSRWSTLKLMLGGTSTSHRKLFLLHQELGPMFLINGLRSLYVIGTQRLVEPVFNQPTIFPERMNSGIRYIVPLSVLGLPTNSTWKTHRTMLSFLFTDRYLRSYGESARRISESYWSDGSRFSPVHCQQTSRTGVRIPIVDNALANLTYDILAHTVMGADFLGVAPLLRRDDLKLILGFVSKIALLPPWLYDYAPVAGRKKAMSALAAYKQSVIAAVETIRQNPEQNREAHSLLHLMALMTDPQPMTPLEIASEILGLAAAGHETTANTLTFALYFLAKNPRWQQRCRDELLQHAAGTEAEGQETEKVQFDKVPNLVTLWAVFRETLRLFPTVAFTSRIVTQDTSIGEYEIAKGSTVMTNMFACGRNPDVFPDPNEFRPERWLDNDGAWKEGPNRVSTAAEAYSQCRNFGGGLRTCVGRRFAETESIIILAVLLSK